MRLITILFTILWLTACGTEPETSSLQDDDRGSASFGISFDGDNFGTTGYMGGRSSRPETRVDSLSVGGSSVSGDGDSDTGGSGRIETEAKEEKSEPVVVEITPGDDEPFPEDCFVHEAAVDRDLGIGSLPSIKPRATISVMRESYPSREAAEQSFKEQLDATRSGVKALWDKQQPVIDATKQILKYAGVAHNRDVYRTLELAETAASAVGSAFQDFKTSPTSHGGRAVRNLGTKIKNAFDELPNKFNGAELSKRSKIIKSASAALKIADGVYSTGDMELGDAVIEIGKTLVDVGLGFVPIIGWAKDVQEAVTGYSMIYQRDLTAVERGWAIFGAVTGGIGSKFKLARKGYDGLKAVAIGRRSGDTAAESFDLAKDLLGTILFPRR